MEAARLPMIYFAPKLSSEKTEFTSVLLSLITTHFGEDASGYARECHELDELRVAVCNAPLDYTACSTLKRYYCQLCFLLNRFPFLVGESVPGLDFTWEDAYEGNTSTHREVEFEKAAVLYNIAAIHSYLGTSDNRSTADGMKVSCTHLQCAAWAFQQVRDNFNSTYAEDWTYDILSFQEQTMLGQSQECILEKSMADNRKSSITAKVAAQCSEFYKKALSHLDSSNPSRHFGSSQAKKWKKHLELKINFTQCVTYYYLTLQAEEQQNYGERLAYAQAAATKLADCVKLSQGMSEDIKAAIQFINDVVTGKHTAAKKENDFVYHAKVPALDSLPEVKGAVLVKGIGFDVSDKTVSGPDIFAKLVPMEAHEASFLYSEEKAKLLREVGGKLDECDTILGQYMASLQINTDKLLPQFDTIPDVLVEKCAAISVRPDTMKDLNKAMNELAGISTTTLAAIDKTEQLLQDETEQEEEFQSKFGKRRLLVLVEEITTELEKCKQAFTKASQSNTELHKAMELHVQNLNLLASPLEEIKSALPNPQSVLADNEVAVVTRIKQLFSKIEEMRAQRTELYSKLREQVMADDITKTIVTRSSDDTKELFAAQLTKHDDLVGQINVYMNAQPKILEALDKANVDFVPIKQKIDLALQQRDARVEALVYSYDVYEDLLDKQQKGMEFYKKLKHNVERLLEKTSGLHSAQQKEREMIAEKMKPKGPPPQRPTATKPGVMSQSKQDMPEDKPVKPSGGTPKLKDYLPFMKGGGNAAGAIDSIADGAAIDDDMADFDDLDDVELPDVSATPKLKDFLPFMTKNKLTGAPTHGSASGGSGGDIADGGDLAELAPQLMKYLPQNMAVGTATMPAGRPSQPQYPQRPPMFSTAQFNNAPSNLPRYAGAVAPNQQRLNLNNNTPQPQPLNVSNYGANVRPAAPLSAGGYSSSGPGGPMSSTGGMAQQQAAMMAGNMPSQSGLTTSYSQSLGHLSHGNMRLPAPGSLQNGGQEASTLTTSGGNSQQPPQSQVQPHSQQPPQSQVPPHSQQPPQSQVQPHSQQPPQSQVQPHSQQPPQSVIQPQTHQSPSSHIPQQPPQSLAQSQSQHFSQSQVPSLNQQPPQSLAQPQFQQPLQMQFQSQLTSQGQVQYQIPPQNLTQSMSRMPQENRMQLPNPAYQPGQTQGPSTPQQPMQRPEQQLPSAQSLTQNQLHSQHPITSTNQPPLSNIMQQPSRPQLLSSHGQPTVSRQHTLQGDQIPPHLQVRSEMHSGWQMEAQGQGPQHMQSQSHLASPKPVHPQQQQSIRGLSGPSGQLPSQGPFRLPTGSQNVGVRNQLGSNVPVGPQNPIRPDGQAQPQSQLAQGQAYMGMQMPTPTSMQSTQQAPTISYPTNQQQVSPSPSLRAPRGPMPNQFSTNTPNSISFQVQRVPCFSSAGPVIAAPNTYPSPSPQVPQTRLPDPSQYTISHGPKPNVEDLLGGTNIELPETGVLLPSNRATDNNVPQPVKSEMLANKPPQLNQSSDGTHQHQKLKQEPSEHSSVTPQPSPASAMQPRPHFEQSQTKQTPVNQPQNLQKSQPKLQQPNHDIGKHDVTSPQDVRNAANSNAPPSSQSTERGAPNWLPNQPGTQTHSGQSIPVLAVSPQPKSHIRDLEGVTIAPSSRLESSFQSGIDWSKATITPQPVVAKKDTTDAPSPKPAISNTSTRSENGSSSRRNSLNRQMSRDHRDPYSDEISLNQFVSAVERYVKQLGTLTKPSLKGPTPLDKEWQDMCEEQEREHKRNSTAAGLSESTRNRHPDYIPYDKYRVVLSEQKNDYINASKLENLPSGCPTFIATQGPLNQTEADFWNMIVQEKVELIVMVSRWTEQDHSESARYWPRDRSDRLSFGNLLITLLLTNNHKHWIERRIVMTNLVTKQSHTVTQLQFTCWPALGTPEPMPLLMLVNEVTSFHKKQRNSNTPIVVHCGNGASKTGVFCTLYHGVLAVSSGQGITNVAQTVGLLRQRRRGMVSSKEEYLFCHTALLYYAQDILVKRGILTSQASFSNPLPSAMHQTHGRTPSNDFIMSDTSLALLGELSSFPSSDLAPACKAGSSSAQQPVEKKSETGKASAGKVSHSKECPPDHNTVPTTVTHDTAVTTDTAVVAKETNATIKDASSTLLEISNPQTFDIGEGRQRITKADFLNPTGSIKSRTNQADDPLSSLDAMWSLAGK